MSIKSYIGCEGDQQKRQKNKMKQLQCCINLLQNSQNKKRKETPIKMINRNGYIIVMVSKDNSIKLGHRKSLRKK